MTPTKRPYVIVGAGMSGLLAALLVKKWHPTAEITFVEQSPQAGGEYRGLELDGFGYCDRAMRVIYETGFPEFDELLHGLLPENDWHVLPENRKDIVGLFWRGELQTNCQYIDLRRLPEAARRDCEQEILQHAGNGKCASKEPSAAEFLTARFGWTTARHLETALEKLYCAPARALHPSATHHPAMNRVVLYGEERMQPVLQSEAMRSVIAWPQQLTFPLKRQPAQSGLYPRRFGMSRVIDAAVNQLQAQGVRLCFSRRVASLETTTDHELSAVTLDNGERIERPALLINANGLPGSFRMLAGTASQPAPPKPPRSWMVFLRSKEPPAMGGLYHFFCYDEAYRTFRVTNYSRYCPAAENEAGFPLCVELWSDDETATEAGERALGELRAMGVLNRGRITGQAAVEAPNFHALCTLEQVRYLRWLRTEIAERSPRNLITVGPHMEENVMLLFEVWRAMYPLLAQRL